MANRLLSHHRTCGSAYGGSPRMTQIVLRWIFLRLVPGMLGSLHNSHRLHPFRLPSSSSFRGRQPSVFIPRTARCTHPLDVQPFPKKKLPVSGRRRRQWYRLASVRRSNPACGSPALGFHNSMLFSILPTKVSVKQGLPTLTRRIVFFQAMFSNHSTANVCCAVTRCVALSIGPVG